MLTDGLKKLILRLFDRLGYVVVKKPTLARSSTGSPSSSSSISVTPSRESTRWDADVCKRFGLAEDAIEPEFRRFYQRVRPHCALPATHVLALYCAMRYLGIAGIGGDVVDCGDGASHTLAVIGAALAEFGDTERRLILCDVSGDPTHRAERKLALWGNDADFRQWRRQRPATRTPIVPDDVRASGYPASKIHVVYSADAAIDNATAIVFLGLTSESYPANRAATTQLLPRLAVGGVFGIDTTASLQPRRGAVPAFLHHQRLAPPVHRVTATYWIGLNEATTSGYKSAR